MWRLSRYAVAFAAGQVFQHLMERRELERLEQNAEPDAWDAALDSLERFVWSVQARRRS